MSYLKEIWKFPLTAEGRQEIMMPKGAKMLTVQVQREIPYLWAQLNPEAPREDVTIRTLGTGHSHLEEGLEYIGTYQVSGGALVWHVFKEVE